MQEKKNRKGNSTFYCHTLELGFYYYFFEILNNFPPNLASTNMGFWNIPFILIAIHL